MKNIKVLAREGLKFLACGYAIPNYSYICGAAKEFILPSEIWIGPWYVDPVGLLALASSKLYGIRYNLGLSLPPAALISYGRELNLSLEEMKYNNTSPYTAILQYLRFTNPYLNDKTFSEKIRFIAKMSVEPRTYAILHGIIEMGEEFCK